MLDFDTSINFSNMVKLYLLLLWLLLVLLLSLLLSSLLLYVARVAPVCNYNDLHTAVVPHSIATGP